MARIRATERAVPVALIGLLRRRLDLAFAGVGVIVLGQVVTQTLKRFVLPRPDLVEVSALLLVVGGILWGSGLAQGIDVTAQDDTWESNAYLGANTLSAGLAGLALLLFWNLWHRREIAPRVPAPSSHGKVVETRSS